MKRQSSRVIAASVFAVLLVLRLAAAENAVKQFPLDGTWQWDFAMPDGGKVTPRVKFKTEENALTGVSRFRAGSETTVTNIVLNGDRVSFDVVREHEGETVLTHYSGRLASNTIAGKVTMKSNGEERSYDWLATRVSGLDGVWTVSVDVGRDRPFESRLTLKQEGERVTGKLRSFRRDSDIHRGRFKNGRISFEVERPAFGGAEKSTNRYHGRVSGDKMVGTVEMNRFGGEGLQTNDWEAVRAD